MTFHFINFTSRMKNALSILLLLLVFTGCRHKKETTWYSEAERQALDSIVHSVHSIDSLLILAKSYEQSGNVLGQIVTLRQLGKEYRDGSQFMKAIDCLNRGLLLATQIHDTLEMIQAYNNIGTNYRRLGSLEEAASHHHHALMLITEMGDQTSAMALGNRVVTLNGLGNVLMSLGNLEQADSIFRLSLAGEKVLDSKRGMAINYANIGSIKSRQGDLDSAYYFFNLSREMNEVSGSRLGIALCYIRFGELDEKNGLLDKAIGEYKTAYELLEKLGDEWHWLEAVLNIARIDIREGRIADARTYLDMASSTVARIGSQDHQVSIYQLYYELNEKTGHLRQALDNYIKATELKDSLVNTKKLNNIQNQRLANERLHRQHELELAQNNLELEQSEKATMLLAIIAVVLLAIGIVGLMWYHMYTRAVKQRIQQQVQQVRENFFTNITHEFRTPLTVILGLGRQLETLETENLAQVRSSAKMIVRQGNSLLELINMLLDISKVRSAIGNPQWQHDNIVSFVEKSVENHRPLAEKKNLELTFSHSQPSLEADFVTEYMGRIMSHLLTNAIKYTPAHGKISVTLEQSDYNRMKIQMTDTGRGIKPEALPHIFEAFPQSDTLQGDVGSGLGLSLVRLMVEAMNGSISVESVLGQGATFTIVMPVKNKSAVSQNRKQEA